MLLEEQGQAPRQGVLPQAAPPQGVSQTQEPGAEAAEGQPNVTPEEQNMYDNVVSNAKRYIHGAGADSVVQQLSQGPPTKAIGKVAANIGMMMSQSAQQAGVKVPGDVLFHAGNEIVGDLVEVAEAAGVVPEMNGPEEQQFIEQSFWEALKQYGEMAMANGTMDPAAIEEAKAAAGGGQQPEGQMAQDVGVAQQPAPQVQQPASVADNVQKMPGPGPV